MNVLVGTDVKDIILKENEVHSYLFGNVFQLQWRP
jgi:hypothetical protein